MATEIKQGELVLARLVRADEAWNGGLNFFSKDDEFVQVGTWSYEQGKQLKAHIHNELPREALWTQEVIFVRKGKMRAFIYGTNEELVTSVDVHAGDVIALLRGGHGYEILEEGTQVLEVKNGPYFGPDKDRRRF